MLNWWEELVRRKIWPISLRTIEQKGRQENQEIDKKKCSKDGVAVDVGSTKYGGDK